MAKQPVQKEINGSLYEFRYFSPTLALKLLTRLTAIFGESLAVLGDSFAGKKSGADLASALDNELPANFFDRFAKALIPQLNEDVVLATVKEILTMVHLQGPTDAGPRTIRFETDFEGKVLEMLQVVYAALEVNYGDFFGAGSGLAATFRKVK